MSTPHFPNYFRIARAVPNWLEPHSLNGVPMLLTPEDHAKIYRNIYIYIVYIYVRCIYLYIYIYMNIYKYK